MTNDKIYRASINFYSNDKDDLVTVMTEVSDPIEDGQNIPAAYTSMQVMAMQLMASAVPMELDDNVMEDAMSNESNEGKAAALLAAVTPTELTAAEIIA